MIGNLGSNTMPECMKSVGMSLGIIAKACSTFEHESEMHENKPYPKFTKDLKYTVDQLVSDKVRQDHQLFAHIRSTHKCNL